MKTLKTLLPVEATKMKGKPGHCIAAQIFDKDGLSLAVIDSRYGAKRATAIAKEIEVAVNNRSLLEDAEAKIKKLLKDKSDLVSMLQDAADRTPDPDKYYPMIRKHVTK